MDIISASDTPSAQDKQLILANPEIAPPGLAVVEIENAIKNVVNVLPPSTNLASRLGDKDPIKVLQAMADDENQSVEAPEVEPTPAEDSSTLPAVPAPASTVKASAPLAEPAFIYAMGRIEAQFPCGSVEKLYNEMAHQQFGPEAATKSRYDVLSLAEHRFLAEKMCWVLAVEGVACYVLIPKTAHILQTFIAALESRSSTQFEHIIAQKGPVAAEHQCAGRAMPTAYVHHFQSHNAEQYCQLLSQQTGLDVAQVKPLLVRMLTFCRTPGELAAQRALNFICLKCTALYKTFAALVDPKNSNEGIDIESIYGVPVGEVGGRERVTLVFAYFNAASHSVERHHITIDVSELYPFSCSELISGEPMQ